MRDVHEFLDEFTSMLSSDVVIVSNNREQHNQFLYAGFYKLLLDMHLMRRNVRSRIFINPYKEEISFPDIDTVLHGLHRREKALYLTMLVMSSRGGVNFASPATSRQREAYDRRMNKLQEMYRHFYGIFGGIRIRRRICASLTYVARCSALSNVSLENCPVNCST